MEKHIHTKELSPMESGRQAFIWFKSGVAPFRGKDTPKNPHKIGTAEFADWKIGYESEQTKWFAA